MAAGDAPWPELNSELLLLVAVTFLPCFVDRASFARICRSWREAVKHLAVAPPLVRQLPWLLLPSDSDDAPSTFASFLSGAVRRINLPADLRHARLCGSHDGGWLAVAYQPDGPYRLVNIFSRSGAGDSSSDVPLPGKVHQRFNNHMSYKVPLKIRGITLSADPRSPGCLVAAHACNSSVVFCRPGIDQHWMAPIFMHVNEIDDMLYHKGEVYQGFYALYTSNFFCVYMVADITAPQLVMKTTALSPVQVDDDYLIHQRRMCDPVPMWRSRYLVESRGRLLMVARYAVHPENATYTARKTLGFKLYEMQMKACATGGYIVSWVELKSLDGRVIFVGRGCSRAFEVGECTGFKGGSIYFCDDHNEIAFIFDYEDGAFYHVVDMGMYSTTHDIVRPGLLGGSANQESSVYCSKDQVGHDGGGSHPNEASTSYVNEILPAAGTNFWSFRGCESTSLVSRPCWFLP